MATSGSLRVEVIEAKLTRDTEFFSKMDPYCVLESRMQKFRTRTLQGAGKTPKWDQVFDLDVKYIGDDLKIVVFDEDVSASDKVSKTLKILSSISWLREITPLLTLFRLVRAPSRSPLCVSTMASMSGSPSSTRVSSPDRFTLRVSGSPKLVEQPRQVALQLACLRVSPWAA